MPSLTQAAAAPAAADSSEDALYRKVMRRILPLLLLCYVVAYLERRGLPGPRQRGLREAADAR